ncbi:MAG: sensor histidine kinase, partial [Gemmatimonadota bacterium]
RFHWTKRLAQQRARIVAARAAAPPLTDAVRGEEPIVSSAAEPGHRPRLVPGFGAEHETVVAVPLLTSAGVIGSLGFGYRAVRPFGRSDRDLLLALGRQCAQALERARLYETEHEARRAAEAASRAKTQFVGVMSHELRTPLSAIIGYQELLSEEIAGPLTPEQRTQLGRIRASAIHLRDLITQILSLSRIDAGKEEVLRQEVDLVSLTVEAAGLVRPEAEARGLDLQLDVPEGPVRVETDPAKVRQIVEHLLSNAIKFTREGRVTASLHALQEQVRIGVRDTGIGIDPADRERVFEEFTQVDQSMTRSAGGSGLGLAVSRRLARLLGGELELESETGSGSTFTLRLPRTLSE